MNASLAALDHGPISPQRVQSQNRRWKSPSGADANGRGGRDRRSRLQEGPLASSKDAIFKREASMFTLRSLGVVIALSIAMPLVGGDTAFAAKKNGHVTYQQAWALCKKEADALPRDAEGQRYARGGACMHRYGYRP